MTIQPKQASGTEQLMKIQSQSCKSVWGLIHRRAYKDATFAQTVIWFKTMHLQKINSRFLRIQRLLCLTSDTDSIRIMISNGFI